MTEIALGFDYGRRKIGIAVGRASTGFAEGIATIPSTPPVLLWSNVSQLISDWQPDTLVVGLPITSGNNQSSLVKYIQEFGEELSFRFQLPVNFVDETLTTDFADAIIREITPHGKQITSRRKLIRDQIAAELILSTYLNEFKTARSE